MSRNRPSGTLVDYLVAAIEPALIMAMVGSLMFFLLDLWYQGPFLDRLRWILFWFVLGIVMITRVSMRIGTSLAMGYGVALGGAVSLVASVLAGFQPLLIAILGLVWWATHRLTFDCTLLDDDQDAGVGLLQEAGLDLAEHLDSVDSNLLDNASPADAPPAPVHSWWSGGKGKAGKARRPHPPGIWLIYFTVVSLPLFGLGQWLVPAVQEEKRAGLFLWFVAYVASALGLLLATSFLNLRRYLQQRKIRMPAAMTATWLSTGAGIIVGFVVLVLVLPLPGSGFLVLDGTRQESTTLSASSHAVLRDSGVQGEGAASEGKAASQAEEGKAEAREAGGSGKTNDPNASQKTSGQGRPGGKSGRGRSKSGTASGKPSAGKGGSAGQRGASQDRARGSEKTESRPSDQRAEQARDQAEDASDAEKTDSSSSERESGNDANRSPESSRSPSPSMTAFQAPAWLRWIVLAAGGILAVIALARHGSAILQAIRDLLASLLGGLWFDRPRRKPQVVPEPAAELKAPPVPFSSYANPFESGLSRRFSPNDLVLYSFEALEAWAGDHRLSRLPQETPAEFARRLESERPELRPSARRLAEYLALIVYGKRTLKSDIVPSLRQFWGTLEGQASPADSGSGDLHTTGAPRSESI